MCTKKQPKCLKNQRYAKYHAHYAIHYEHMLKHLTVPLQICKNIVDQLKHLKSLKLPYKTVNDTCLCTIGIRY